MPRDRVSDYLERAREIAALADRRSAPEQQRLMQIAEAWLKLADDAAVEAAKSATVAMELSEQRKSH